jgi:hypothetical protein
MPPGPDLHKQKPVGARLDDKDFERLERVRKHLRMPRRQAIITALREWLDRNETTSPESEERQ